MLDRFSDMLRRHITIDWEKDTGPVDLRYHSAGIGGVHSMPAPQPVIQAMAALKPRFIRIFLQEFFYIYPGHGVFDWLKMDAYMEAVHAMGGDIMASICIKPKILYPDIAEGVWMPNNISEWQALIRAMTLRYSKEKPYVTHWAVANEMNIGEWGGCPYLIENPDDYFEYYKITAAPIREALPGIKVGGPSYAGGGENAAKYLARFIDLCKQNNIAADFTCYNEYSDDPARHAASARAIRGALDKHDSGVKLYMTEFNMNLVDDLSLEEAAYDPKRAAGLGAAVLDFHEDGSLDGSFQYHIYDQWNDPREFAPWYARTRYMAEHWNDMPHRLGLLDLDGKARPQYFLYQMLYSLTGRRVGMEGSGPVLRGLASRNADDTLSVFMVNYALRGTPEMVARFRFANTPAGVYRMNVYRIDKTTAAAMKRADETPAGQATKNPANSAVYRLPAAESRITYVHPDFHFDVYTPADSVTLVQLIKE